MNTSLASARPTRAPLLPRVVGGAAWALALLGLAWLASALLTLHSSALALLALAATVGVSALAPRALRRASRHRPPLRAVVDGVTLTQRYTLAGQVVAFGALAAAALAAAFDAQAAVGGHVTTFLAGAIALLLVGVAAGVVFPGAWFISGRARPLDRWLWLPLAIAGVAIAFPLAPLVHRALLDASAVGATLTWELADLLALGLLSAIGTATAFALFPRPWVAVDVAPTGATAVAARLGGGALVDVATGRTRATFLEGRRIARFSSDGAMVALDAPDDEVVLRDGRDGAVVRRLDGAPTEVRALAFSPTGRHVAAVGDGGWVAIWDLEALAEVDATAPAPATRVPTGLTFGRSLVFSADGRELVIASNAGALVRVKLSDPKQQGRPSASAPERPLTESGLTRATLVPGGRVLAGAAGAVGSPTRVLTLSPHGHQLVPGWSAELGDTIRALAFDASGDTLLAVTLRSDLRLFDARTGAARGGRDQLGGTVASVAATADLRHVVIGGRWAIRVWDRDRDVVTQVDAPPARLALTASA